MNNMKILAIDTSTEYVFLAAFEYQGQWLSHKNAFVKPLRDKDNWLEQLSMDFLSVSDETRSKFHFFDGFALGGGPGSFTGLRIGFTYFKTISLLSEKLFFTFSSAKLYHLLFCRPEELLFLPLNRELYHVYDPFAEVEPEGAQNLMDCLKLIPESRHSQLSIWGRSLEESVDHPKFRQLSPHEIRSSGPLSMDFPEPDFLMANKSKLLKTLPAYGHNVIINRNK